MAALWWRANPPRPLVCKRPTYRRFLVAIGVAAVCTWASGVEARPWNLPRTVVTPQPEQQQQVVAWIGRWRAGADQLPGESATVEAITEEDEDDEDDDEEDDDEEVDIDELLAKSRSTKVEDDEEDESTPEVTTPPLASSNQETGFVEEDNDEEEEDLDAPLAMSTMKATSKTKARVEAQQGSAIKQVVSQQLAATAATSAEATTTPPRTIQRRSHLGKFLRIPYIVRACLNPITMFYMTRAYWASLFNLNYLPSSSSSGRSTELRSALEEKAKKSGGSPPSNRGKRQMKRGQAKTLADLPQLST